MHPLLILAIGIASILGLILVLRVNAFMALIISAIVVSLLAPGQLDTKIQRVADAFGSAAGSIGIVIALAAIIGECMMVSGAADRIVQAFLSVLGQKRASWALLGSGYVLAIPVFFDTVFYLLVPLARSLYRKTNRNYLLYIMAIAAGGAITHTLVPPTPGPLVMAAQLNIDLGVMIIVGAIVAFPAAVVGLVVSHWFDAKLNIPFRETREEGSGPVLEESQLPPLWLSLLPVLLPVILIGSNTATSTALKAAGEGPSSTLKLLADVTALLGNSNFALLLSTIIAMYLVWRQKRMPLSELTALAEQALMSGGTIILITAAGGAFGKMLQVSGIKEAIEGAFQGQAPSGMVFILLGYSIAVLMKIAQGSSTVAMITVSGMLAAMVGSGQSLGYHPVYLATAIGAGSLMGSWMNDSGFWIFAKMGRLTEAEALKSWTIMLAVLSLVSLATTILLAKLMPLV